MPIIDYLILTPLDEEFRSFREVWPENLKEDKIGGVHYYKAVHHQNGRDTLVVAASMGGMGQAWSGIFATDALKIWAPAKIVQLGIAGSLRGTKLPLGDVFIPGEVIGYEIAEALEDAQGRPEFQFRPTGHQAGFSLLNSAAALVNSPTDTRLGEMPRDMQMERRQ